MKKAIDYLIEQYGCKDLEDLQKCFLNPDDVSITMLTETIETAQKEAYNEAIEDVVNQSNQTAGQFISDYRDQLLKILRLKKK